MSNYFKLKIFLFYLFLLFSCINNKELLNEWENNTYMIESVNPPISLVVNNLTNTKLYLYKEYIYIINENGEDYNIGLGENVIKSIDSPLIVYNNSYYICSSSGLFQIINKTIQKLDISITKNTTNLKCFYYKNGVNNYILIGLIGDNYLLNYNLNKQSSEKKYTDKYLVDINSNSIDTNIPSFITLSKDNNNKYILEVFKYENGDYVFGHEVKLSDYSDFKTSNELNIKISFLSDQLIIILTYISDKEFNFYHVNYGSKEIKLIGGKNLLRSLNEYNLINAYFIENTPIIYYIINKNGRYYLGAADLQYFIILYNIEIPKNYNISFEQGYYYQSKGFLNYFDNNIQQKICPFVSNSTLCQHKLKNKYFVISKEYSPDGLYKNYFSNFCSNGETIGHYCIENCPTYSVSSGQHLCSICQYNYYFNYANKKCSAECEYKSDNKICYDCEIKNKIYYNNDCLNSCSEVYKLYDKEKKTCVSCGNKKYFDTSTNNTCVDKCPDNYEIDEENKACIHCKDFNMYSLKSSNGALCYKKCPFFYYSDKESYECKLCKNNQFYKNGECVEDCGNGYSINSTEINGIKIQYCFSCKAVGKVAYDNKCYESCNEINGTLYEENGACVDKCSEGFIQKTQKCESCLEKGLYYYNNTCKEKCSDFKPNLAWNEADHICKDCGNLYIEDNKCVSQCKTNSRIITIDKVCFTCPSSEKYYASGYCYKQCPEYSVPNKLEEYCSFCPDDRIFYKNKCIKECKEPYVKNQTESNRYICQKCEEGKYYSFGECKEQCDDEKCYKLDEDQSCRLCFCFEKGKCKNNINECECSKDEKGIDNYFGKNCEFSRKIKEDIQLEINPIYNKALKTNVSFYNFTIHKADFKNYKIKWEFFLGTKEITSDPEYQKYFITGNKEEIFGINPNLFSEIKNNYLHLTLINENDKDDILEDEIRIYVQNFEIKSEHKAAFLDPKLQDTGLLYKAIKTKIGIEQSEYSNLNNLKYYYQFSFLDGNNEEIPLTNFINDDSIETYYIPFAKQYLVTLKNDRGEIKQYQIKKDDSDLYKNFNNDDFNSKSIKDIKTDSNYNDIEKIFIFMVIFNYKGKILTDEDLKELFNYIDNIYGKFLNEEGYYNINNDNNNQNIIYYSEPRLLFALINSIIISQKKIMNNININLIYKSLNTCVNMLKNKKIKLSSKDIISLLRTIEQLHIVYNEFSETNKNDSLNFNNLFGEITNYLSLIILPGEGIKIIGNRTILFSYNLGAYQNLLAISSNLNSPAKISDINTYSYEDYGLNEEDCGKRGETFLCMHKDIYKNIKNKIQLNGHDIKDISLNIYIVNNIKNNNQDEINKDNNNENDNYIVSLQFYDLNNKNKINLTLDDNNFYSLEFNYKNEKKKMNSPEINDKKNKFYMPYNYSNVVCYPKNHIHNSSYYCFTYFDYFKNIIQCKCNILDEITIVENKELSDFYKKLQFKTINYTYTNNITRNFIILFLMLLLIPGLLFLLYDICKVNKYINKMRGYTIKEKRREYYNEVKNYTSTKLTFPIYSTFNQFPYCAAFNVNNYTSPKYIKHFIVITALLLGFILNLIPFYFTIPFIEKQILIDKRDINIEDAEIHSIGLIDKYLINGFIYALISLIFVHLFIKLFNKILNIDKKNIKYWKNIKDIFKDYVYFEIKKTRYLGKNFARIKSRMKAFYSICGRYLLNKNVMNHPERNKKLENYLKYTGKIGKTNLLITSKKIQIKDESKLKDNKIGTNKESLLYELPENNYSINDENTLLKKNEYKPPTININIKVNIPVDKNVLVSSSFGIKQNNKFGDILKKLKPMKSDNFQIGCIINNKFGITNNTIERLEKIKNKYISKNKSRHNAILKENNNISPLSIYYNNNLSIIRVEDYKECEKKDVSGETKMEFRLMILMTLVLGLIFFVLIISSIVIIKRLLNEYEYFMVKIWLLCTILILFVAYFLLYFIKNIIGTILLFNCYAKRKSGCFLKFMFKIFVDKSLIYMFKIRNYITKYKRDFINI